METFLLRMSDLLTIIGLKDTVPQRVDSEIGQSVQQLFQLSNSN